MKRLIGGLCTLVVIAYPFFVLWGLKQNRLTEVAAGLAILSLLQYWLTKTDRVAALMRVALGGGLAIISVLSQGSIPLKLYPVCVNVVLLISFALSLRSTPMIERFARLKHPQLSENARRWCLKVTKVWCLFFVFNASVALITVIWGSDAQWVLYNGAISYVLIALLIVGEWVLRRRQLRREDA